MYRLFMANFNHKQFLLFAAVAVLSFSSCGKSGSTSSAATAELQGKLEACEQRGKQKDGYAGSLKERIEELNEKQKGGDGDPTGEGNEVIVTIAGDALRIVGTTGKGPHEGSKPSTGTTKPGNADDQALYKSFLKAVNRSRGGIKKCYQRALKADSSLQARTISLKIKVRYDTAGKVTGTGFSPKISSKFDSCMGSITRRWKLPAPPRPVSFRAPVTLTPQ